MADKPVKMKTVEFEFPDPDAEEESLEIEIAPDENTTYNVLETPEPPKEELPKGTPPVEAKVDVVDDTPPKDQGREASDPPAELTEDELKDYGAKTQKRLKHFSKGYHDQRRVAEAAQREKEEALRYAENVLKENQQLKATSSRSRNSLIAQAKKAAEAEAATAERDYKTAYESGDADKVLAAQKKLTAAQVKLSRANTMKPSALPKKQPPQRALQGNETPVQVPQQVPQTQPQQPQVDQKAVAWQKNNAWFGPDKEMTAFALGVHNRLEEEGVNTQSDDYYDKLNTRMREVFPSEFKGQAPDEPNDSVVAPVTRSTAPRKYTLNKSQVAIAKRLNVPLEDYAKQAAMLEGGR